MNNNSDKNSPFFSDIFWRYLTHIWTVVFIILVVCDFLYTGKFEYLLTPFSIIYGAILSIFVGTKEFDRWYNVYKSKQHPGELFVIAWSIVVFGLVIASWALGKNYQISSDVISVYIMVLTVFAITQGSKRLHHKRR
ncbi:MAG: hypothetical protein WC705_01670 [Candidatus Paceibacterota bacterium]|jgi:hypothetical protein